MTEIRFKWLNKTTNFCLRVTMKKLKNGVSKYVVHVMKHVNFQIYRAHPDGVIWKKLTIDDKYINKRV